MTPYNKISALYSRLSVGDEDRDGGESNSIVNQEDILSFYYYLQQEQREKMAHRYDCFQRVNFPLGSICNANEKD